MKYKHIKFNNMMQKIDWALEQVSDEWQLVNIVPIDMYESIAIFVRPTTSKRSKETRK